MPSRKKAKGKARKAAKEAKAKAKAKAKEDESRAVVAANQRQDESVEAWIQRLEINDATSQECWHGLVPLSAGEEKICMEFIETYFIVFNSQDNVGDGLLTAHHATEEKYPDVYDSKLDAVISILLSIGTQFILGGDSRLAQVYASVANYFKEVQNYMAVELKGSTTIFSWTKVMELESADDHTLVSYYRKYIPCSCLDGKYREVKSLKKMGCCYNPNCSHPDGLVERSKMFCCTRCGEANYCSFECQRADWKQHRVQCDAVVKMKVAFDSEQS